MNLSLSEHHQSIFDILGSAKDGLSIISQRFRVCSFGLCYLSLNFPEVKNSPTEGSAACSLKRF